MAIDRDKYRRLFIEEARESLRAFNNELVTVEKLSGQAGGDGRAREAMDAAFRHAHSIKGMAAAMGHTRLAAVAHHLEDLASVARQGRAIGGPGFDLLLQGSDVLEGLVERVAQGEEDPDAGDIAARVAAYVATLADKRAPAPAAAAASPLPGPAAAAELVAPATTTPDGAAGDTLVVTVRIADDASLPQVRAFVVHKALAALPGWQKTEPPPETLRTRELVDRKLTLTFDRSTAQPAEIERVARGAQGVADVAIALGVQAPAASAEPAPSGERPAERAPGGEDDRTVRVRTALLDEFIDSVGELLLARSRMRAMATRLELPELGDLVDEIDRLTRDLHGRVVAARMTPLSLMTERFPRVVRDLARKTQKPVDFQMVGTEIELDRAILDELAAPFLHMLRNAVDHGHEGPTARAAAGKPAAMRLSLRASRDRDQVLLELVDDGRGMDPQRLRARAVERGLLSAKDAADLTDAAALELVCLPGFSTAEQVSETSGRGVGMDVVKATLERLGGSLKIESTVGQGTRMVLLLPLTVAIIQVLVIEAGAPGDLHRDAYAIPVARVEQAVDLDESVLSHSHGRAFLKHRGELVPLYDLPHELGHDVIPLAQAWTAAREATAQQNVDDIAAGGQGTAQAPKPSGTVLLVGRGTDLIALRVDAIVGQEEVVAKPLGPPLAALSYLAGATLLADGRAAFILEPQRLVRS